MQAVIHIHKMKQEGNLQVRFKVGRQTRLVAQEISVIHTCNSMPAHIYILRNVDSPL